MIFDEFDFSVINDEYFKEDSVREEIILPIIKALGYNLSGDSKIIRSRSLIHPYVAIGSKQRKISIVPDYVFLSDGSPYWVLDAKSPTEEVVKSKHVEQAYSYAIHPEIRADLFALCNGKEFALFNVKQFEPILHFSIEEIDLYWEKLLRILHPEIKAQPEVVDYHPDYGIHLKRLGVEDNFQFIGVAINTNYIMKVEDGLYTASTVIPAEDEYVMSLDFGEEQLQQLLKILPMEQADLLVNGLKRQPYAVFSDTDFQFGVVANLTSEIFHNAEESYLPFKVKEFMSYIDIGSAGV